MRDLEKTVAAVVLFVLLRPSSGPESPSLPPYVTEWIFDKKIPGVDSIALVLILHVIVY